MFALCSSTIFNVSGHIPEDVISSLISKFGSNKYRSVIDAISDQSIAGYGAEQLIDQLASRIIEKSDLQEATKARILLKLSESFGRLLEGGDDDLAKLDFMSVIMRELPSY